MNGNETNTFGQHSRRSHCLGGAIACIENELEGEILEMSDFYPRYFQRLRQWTIKIFLWKKNKGEHLTQYRSTLENLQWKWCSFKNSHREIIWREVWWLSFGHSTLVRSLALLSCALPYMILEHRIRNKSYIPLVMALKQTSNHKIVSD